MSENANTVDEKQEAQEQNEKKESVELSPKLEEIAKQIGEVQSVTEDAATAISSIGDTITEIDPACFEPAPVGLGYDQPYVQPEL